jgi:hypothetical protein
MIQNQVLLCSLLCSFTWSITVSSVLRIHQLFWQFEQHTKSWNSYLMMSDDNYNYIRRRESMLATNPSHLKKMWTYICKKSAPIAGDHRHRRTCMSHVWVMYESCMSQVCSVWWGQWSVIVCYSGQRGPDNESWLYYVGFTALAQVWQITNNIISSRVI